MLTYARSPFVFQHSALRPIGPFDPGGPGPQTAFTGTASNDHFSGTNGDDTFDLSQGGNDRATGKAGFDYFLLGAALNANDKLDGGGNSTFGDVLDLIGNYAAGTVFNATTITGIESINLYGTSFGGGSYNFALNDGNVASGGYAEFFFSDTMTSLDFLLLDGSAETDGDLVMRSFAAGDDILIGGGANDYINGGRGGTDSLDGGGGINVVSFSSSPTGVTVSLLLQGAAQNVGGGRMVTLNNFQDISGSSSNDVLTGDGNGNWIRPGPGSNDVVQSLSGDDLIELNPSSVLVTADAGIDNDTLSFLGFFATDVVFSLAIQGSGQLVDGTVTVDATNFENVSGGSGKDSLDGDGNGNSLYGAFEADVLNGGDGNDFLYGDKLFLALDSADPDFTRSGFGAIDFGSGKDVLDGGKGKDLLDGGDGKDKLTGGSQRDTLIGGGDADAFVFKKASDSGVGAGNRDTMDFSQSDGDTINVHGIDADTTVGGNQDFFLGGSTFTSTVRELIQFSDGSGHTIVAGDTDGNGAADLEIQLTTAPTLVIADFVF